MPPAVWISCNGEVGINISTNGQVSGCTPKFWTDLDNFFRIAQARRVYVMATLISFDHFSKEHTNYQCWRNLIADTHNIDSLVANYVVPFVNRYKNNPWLWSVDLCNEPDWVHENANCGKLPWQPLQTYFGRAAAAVHANSKILVTVGICMGTKYLSDTNGLKCFQRSRSAIPGRWRFTGAHGLLLSALLRLDERNQRQQPLLFAPG